MAERIVTDVSMSENFTLITVNTLTDDDGIISKILNELYSCGVNVDLISFAHMHRKDLSFSFTVDTHLFSTAISVMGKFKSELPGFFCNIRTNCAKIQVLQQDEFKTDKAAQTLKILTDCGIKLYLVSASIDSIEFIVNESDADEAVKRINEYLKGNG